MPSRPVGRLLDLEYEILDGCATLSARGEDAYGFALAQLIADQRESDLIGHGTLYKALSRLTTMGLLRAEWGENPSSGRPRRRLYTLSGEGELALQARPAPRPAATAARVALA